MSDLNRRTKSPPAPQTPTGYRSSRRGSKALRQAKRAEKQHRVLTGVQRTGHSAKNIAIVSMQGLAALGLTVLVLLLAALLINSGVRWNAQRLAKQGASDSDAERRAEENLLVIGADGDEAAGFLALRIDRENGQVYGIAVPDGAFVDVPGQGFVRIGEAYSAGPEAIVDAVSNFFSVPFRSYVVVPGDVYRNAMTEQQVSGIPAASTQTNLSAAGLEVLAAELGEIPDKNVALVPLPVKPIKLGSQTYFEPQRSEIEDLLKSWWGVDAAQGDTATRVIVFNGSGEPGIAGDAAQRLIRAGIRVVDTQNADSFDYKTTKIVVRRGDASLGEEIRKVLGVGEISVDPTSADVTDVIVIIGKDYEPSEDGNKEGN